MTAKTDTLMKRLNYDTATLDFIVFQKKRYSILSKNLDAATFNASDLSKYEIFQKIVGLIGFPSHVE